MNIEKLEQSNKLLKEIKILTGNIISCRNNINWQDERTSIRIEGESGEVVFYKEFIDFNKFLEDYLRKAGQRLDELDKRFTEL